MNSSNCEGVKGAFFKIVGFACKRFLLSFPLPLHALFCARPNFPAAKNAKSASNVGKALPKRLLRRLNLAQVYDPLGVVSPVMLDGKRIYREACNQKIAWDAPLPEAIALQWTKWENQLPASVSTRRGIPTFQEPIQEIQLHAFGDASGYGVCAAVYAVVTHKSGITQGLVTAKSRLAKQGLTIPRLELVSGHMAANLAVNVRKALDGFPFATNI